MGPGRPAAFQEVADQREKAQRGDLHRTRAVGCRLPGECLGGTRFACRITQFGRGQLASGPIGGALRWGQRDGHVGQFGRRPRGAPRPGGRDTGVDVGGDLGVRFAVRRQCEMPRALLGIIDDVRQQAMQVAAPAGWQSVYRDRGEQWVRRVQPPADLVEDARIDGRIDGRACVVHLPGKRSGSEGHGRVRQRGDDEQRRPGRGGESAQPAIDRGRERLRHGQPTRGAGGDHRPSNLERPERIATGPLVQFAQHRRREHEAEPGLDQLAEFASVQRWQHDALDRAGR